MNSSLLYAPMQNSQLKIKVIKWKIPFLILFFFFSLWLLFHHKFSVSVVREQSILKTTYLISFQLLYPTKSEFAKLFRKKNTIITLWKMLLNCLTVSAVWTLFTKAIPVSRCLKFIKLKFDIKILKLIENFQLRKLTLPKQYLKGMRWWKKCMFELHC